MWQSDELKNHLQTSFTVQSKTAVIAEWNMNVPGNIFKLGNYRYRKNSTQYSALPNIFDPLDIANFYTGATDSDIVIESGLETDNTTPLLFTYPKDLEKLYYSLEDCIKPFRPRSGINKASFLNQYLTHSNENMYLRPRYYMPHRDDEFRYWRSYRTESKALEDGYVKICSSNIPLNFGIEDSNIEYGISKNSSNGIYFIDDACPFIVYKEAVPANRLIIKVQTHVGDINLGPFKKDGKDFNDPFYGSANKRVPQKFNVEYLNENNEWIGAYSFDENSLRSDNSDIFNTDGYLSLQYGLEIPTDYVDNFLMVGTMSSASALPTSNIKGYSYLIKSTSTDIGILYIWNGSSYTQFTPKYNWKIGTDGVYENTQFVTDFTNPSYYIEAASDKKIFTEFVFVKGIRIVVESMSLPNIPFELIEFSPRLVSDITNKTISFSTNKMMCDLGNAAIPVGNLVASTGNLSIFDEDQSFNENNIWNGTSGSIIAKYYDKKIKFNFYEVIREVNDVNYYIPIKTLYSEGIPQVDQAGATLQFTLRDFYFYFESIKAPQILLSEVSLSQAIAILLDSIGFSNYVFKRLTNETDPIIPYFFIAPEQNVAEVLTQLAIATQSAMYFDEYNNFVVVSKNYLLDNTAERPVDIVLYGSNYPNTNGINKNQYNGNLSNIVGISSQDKKVYNDGNITYSERYIQRSYGAIKQAQMIDQEKTWIYKPVLLWEVSGDQSTKSVNENQSSYTLGAFPLNSDLDATPPYVKNNVVVNNIIDLGESVYFLGRYQGYLYSSGEVIRFDAVEFNIAGVGNEWITSNLEYQKYFSSLTFNGKMYPTGNVRIYSEPYYETVNGTLRLKNGSVVQHGRGQFNTEIQYHNSGLDSYWSDNNYVQGCDMESQYLYTTEIDPTLPTTVDGIAGINQAKAQKSKRNGIIRNFLSTSFAKENEAASLKTTQTGTIQSSALVFNGPVFETTENSKDFISYVWKSLDRPYKHFGTRMRIIGKVESIGEANQTVIGSTTYFSIPGTDPTQSVIIGGGSGGISLVNPETNQGYYFEIAALTRTDINSLLKIDSKTGTSTINLDNILFYKTKRNSTNGKATPIKLWGGIGDILVDSGNFVGKNRIINEDKTTVYELSIEYMDLNNNTRVFYLYINNKLIQVVTDTSPIPLTGNTFGLFVRGSTKAMFENVYALTQNFSQNSSFPTGLPIASIFGDEDNEINANEALYKYAISGMVQKTYMKGIMPTCLPVYDMFFDEFGTIMREGSYFKVRYDKAYPALFAKIAATFNRLKGYAISGFMSDAYNAEFLVFNCTDTVISLDETSGNYLRIQGIAFTQETSHTLTVDEYYKKRGNLSDPELVGNTLITSPYKYIEEYDSIRVSRIQYGKNEFSLSSQYIQDQSTAENLLGWIIEKVSRPRKAIGMEIFAMPTLQLGDIININYKTQDGIDIVSSDDIRYVVYNIDYSKDIDGPKMIINAVEV